MKQIKERSGNSVVMFESKALQNQGMIEKFYQFCESVGYCRVGFGY